MTAAEPLGEIDLTVGYLGDEDGPHGPDAQDLPPVYAREADSPADDELEDDETDEKSKKKSMATELVELVADGWWLGSDQDGEPFAVEKGGPLVALPLRGSRSGLRAQLAEAYFDVHGRAPSASALADALTVTEGTAARKDRTKVHLRSFHDPEDPLDTLTIDLGTQTGESAVVRPTAWRIEPSRRLFRRTALTGEMAFPTHPGTGDLAALRNVLNVTDDVWPLLVSWMLAAWLDDQPCPALLLAGEQGTGKTSAAERIIDIVDPSPAPTRTAPTSIDGWPVAASASRVVALDNISGIAGWFSDALCRAVTGDGLVKRALYTDSDISVLRFRRAIILTAIDPGALRGDLADRLLTVELQRIPEDQRRRDADLSAEWARIRPHVLGGLLDLAAAVLDILPTIELDHMPRMADFARLAAAVDQVLGTDGLGHLARQREALSEIVIDSDPVARGLVDLAASRTEWTGTAGDLLATLREIVWGEDRPDKWWPKNPQRLAMAIKRASPELRRVGVEVESVRSKRGRTYRVTSRTEKAPSHASLASPASPEPLNRGDAGEIGDAPGDASVTHAPDASPSRHPMRHPEEPASSRGNTAETAVGDASDAPPEPFSVHGECRRCARVAGLADGLCDRCTGIEF